MTPSTLQILSPHRLRPLSLLGILLRGRLLLIVALLLVGSAASQSVVSQSYCAPPLCLDWSSAESDDTTSVAWGDYDGDGDLDLAVGNLNGPNRLYRNDGGVLTASAVWSSTESDRTTSVAWGDVDGDGDLDLVVGNRNGPNRLYRNNGGMLTTSAVWSSVESDDTTSVAWGDVDGDGDLDLAVGNSGAPNRLYRNNGGVLTASAVWSSIESDDTTSVAWGDVDGDGDLDLAVGNSGASNRLYRNNGGVLTASAVWSSTENDDITSVAWGDVDGDGDLDLAVGNRNGPNRLYRNDGGVLTASAVWSSTENDATYSIAWGDADGDGDLDLAVGNGYSGSSFYLGQPNRLYRNDNGALTVSAVWSSNEGDDTRSVVWGDVDGDGDLDLVVGNIGAPNRLYRSDGGVLTASATWSSTESDATYSIAWGDVDGDGDLDLAVGNDCYPSVDPNCRSIRLYRNDGGALTASAVWSSAENDRTTSVAWGDVDGDDDLDLAVGNDCYPGGDPNCRSIRLYRNDGGVLTASAVWSSTESDNTTSVAWGDYDGDGDLDLVVGNLNGPNRLYRNDGGALTASAVWSSTESDRTTSVAWGDVDDDGDLDLAVGNSGAPNRLYRNDSGALTASAVWSSIESDNTTSVAWGDVDGDGDLDLAVGNSGAPNRLYRNDGGVLMSGAVWSSTESDDTTSVAWGDYDGDGDLDLAVGNFLNPHRLYRNDKGVLTTSAVSSYAQFDRISSIAWGDVDGDGDLDLAMGNGVRAGAFTGGAPNRLYRNTHDGRPFPGSIPTPGLTKPHPLLNANFVYTNPALRTPAISITYTLSDPEGDPVRFIRAKYSLDGGGKWYAATAASGTLTRNLVTSSGALKFDGVNDYVGLGTPAFPAGLASRSLCAWAKTDTVASGWRWIAAYGTPAVSQAMFIGQNGTTLYGGGFVDDLTVANFWDYHWHYICLTYDGTIARLYADGTLRASALKTWNLQLNNAFIGRQVNGVEYWSGTIDEVSVWNTVRSPADIQAGMYRQLDGNTPGLMGYWRLDEGAGLTAYDQTTNHNNGILVNGPTWTRGVPTPMQYLFNWDTFASGFFGQSDDVVFRLEAYSSLTAGANGVPVFQHPYASATTFPFRVRGTQVRVLSGTIPISNAIVYDLRANQTVGALPFADSAGRPFHTDSQGYLQGRGQIGLGDRLVALYPITATDAYTLYYTSAAPTLSGLNLYSVTRAGVQTLVVSPQHPLILFNLDLSLEWDARQDTQFLSQLHHDVQRASEFLYDWSNGQAALGHINLYFDREKWDGAHIRLYASNRLRPNAEQGGLVTDVFTDPITSTIVYNPGQVRIGAVWTRYGDSSGALGEDWPRALAHELSHYALFLDDDYLGLDASNHLIPIDTCVGTAMSDPYREDYSEYRRRDTTWSAQCGSTLAAKETSRADWETVTTMYRWLSSTVNAGPSGLPLNVTQIRDVLPITPTTVLPAPIFNLTQAGAKVQPGPGARAILYQQSNRLIDLGNPTLDQVTARGARLGDRLCVYEASARRLGCETLTAGDEELALVAKLDWQPDILVSPVNSRTINLGVNIAGLPPTMTLRARLYPVDGAASPTITLVRTSGSAANELSNPPLRLNVVYSHSVYLPLILKPPATIPGYAYVGTFSLVEPAPQGYVQVWVNEPEPRRESVIDYTLGGNPAYVHGRGAYLHGRGAYIHGRGAYIHGRGAPAQSSDGQVLIFGDGLIFNPDEFFALQALTAPPAQPPGTTLVGQAYHLLKSAGAPSLSGTSISFNYAGRDVPAGEEDFLHIYYWNGAQWQKLPTVLNTTYNVAVAPTQDVGVYALLSSIEIPLNGPGWTTFGYPAQGSKPVTQALASISGSYGMVYGSVLTDTLDLWKVYAVNVPAWVNDLATLDFGKTYWISVTRAITLQVTGGGAAAPTALPSPPMTVYGTAPTPGTVTAWVNGVPCGQGATKMINGQIVYTLNIQPDASDGKVGCGAAGRIVTFKINSQALSTTIGWDIDRVRNLPLAP